MGPTKCCDFLARGSGEATESLERQEAAFQHPASENRNLLFLISAVVSQCMQGSLPAK